MIRQKFPIKKKEYIEEDLKSLKNWSVFLTDKKLFGFNPFSVDVPDNVDESYDIIMSRSKLWSVFKERRLVVKCAEAYKDVMGTNTNKYALKIIYKKLKVFPRFEIYTMDGKKLNEEEYVFHIGFLLRGKVDLPVNIIVAFEALRAKVVEDLPLRYNFDNVQDLIIRGYVHKTVVTLESYTDDLFYFSEDDSMLVCRHPQ